MPEPHAQLCFLFAAKDLTSGLGASFDGAAGGGSALKAGGRVPAEQLIWTRDCQTAARLQPPSSLLPLFLGPHLTEELKITAGEMKA